MSLVLIFPDPRFKSSNMQTRNKFEICNGNSTSMVNILYYEMRNEFTVRDESMLTKNDVEHILNS